MLKMLEPIENQYIKIGEISRSHGVDGEVLIISDVFAPNLFDEIDLINLQNNRGDLIPARIEWVRSEEKPDRLSFFVKFEHVADRNQAQQLKGYSVYLERDIAGSLIDEPEASSDYRSFSIYNEEESKIGEVEFLIDNPAHPILQVITKNNRQLLIPFVDEYVVSSDKEKKIIRCKNLDQLEDL